jgi:hypothetical protein
MEEDIHYFATFDPDGWPTGFYPSDVWPEPPEGAVEISAVQYRELLQGNRKLVGGKVVEVEDDRTP